MIISDVGLALIRQFEGLRLAAYRDSGGIPSIGYGHTGPDVFMGQTISAERAGLLLTQDVMRAEEAINAAVTMPLTQGMFDSLCSIVFNCGPGRVKTIHDPGRDGIVVLKSGRPSTLLRYINQGEYRAARDQFAAWCMAGGRPLPGLVRRRRAEAELFERDGYQPEAKA